MATTDPQTDRAPAVPARDADHGATGAPWLGRAVAARLGWHARLRSRHPDRAIGRLASGGRHFSSTIGRSLATRSALARRLTGAERDAVTPGSGPAMGVVGPHDAPRIGMVHAASVAAALAEEALGEFFEPRPVAEADAPPLVAPPAGSLPRATLPPGAKGPSGPGGFRERLRAEALPVQSIPDVAAVGRALTPRERRVSPAPPTRSNRPVPPARPSLSAIARTAAGRDAAAPPADEPRSAPPAPADGARPSAPDAAAGSPAAPAAAGRPPRSPSMPPASPPSAASAPSHAPGPAPAAPADAGSVVPSRPQHRSGEDRQPPHAADDGPGEASGWSGGSSTAVLGTPAPDLELAAAAILLAEHLAAAPLGGGPAQVATAAVDGLSATGPRWPAAAGPRRAGPSRAATAPRPTTAGHLRTRRSALAMAGAHGTPDAPPAPRRTSAGDHGARRLGEVGPARARRPAVPLAPPVAGAPLRETTEVPPLAAVVRQLPTAPRDAVAPRGRALPPPDRAAGAAHAPDASAGPSATPETPRGRHRPVLLLRAVDTGSWAMWHLPRVTGLGEETTTGMAVPIHRAPSVRPVVARRLTGAGAVAGDAGADARAGERRTQARGPRAEPAPTGHAAVPVATSRRAGRGRRARPVDRSSATPASSPAAGSPTPRARRFVAELARHAPDPAIALPPRLAPLARALGDAGPVELRAGPASTAALAKAGRPAATVGRVVHLARRPRTDPASAALVAHELVHAMQPAHGGRHRRTERAHGTPRFFHDDVQDHEEGTARRVGTLAHQLVAADAGVLAPVALRRAVAGQVSGRVRARPDAGARGAGTQDARSRHGGAPALRGGGMTARDDAHLGVQRLPAVGALAHEAAPTDTSPLVGPAQLGKVGGAGGAWVPARPREGALADGVVQRSPRAGGGGGGAGSARGGGLALQRLQRDDPGLAALLERAQAGGMGSVAPGGGGAAGVGLPLGPAGAMQDRPRQHSPEGADFASFFEHAETAWPPGGTTGTPASSAGFLPVPLPSSSPPALVLASQFDKKGDGVVESTEPTVTPSSAPNAGEVLEWIIERVEQRVLDELERRGRRHVPEVF